MSFIFNKLFIMCDKKGNSLFCRRPSNCDRLGEC